MKTEAEMAVRGQDIASVIKRQIEEFGRDISVVDVGTVVEVGDGIARVHGLSGVAYNELVLISGMWIEILSSRNPGFSASYNATASEVKTFVIEPISKIESLFSIRLPLWK